METQREEDEISKLKELQKVEEKGSTGDITAAPRSTEGAVVSDDSSDEASLPPDEVAKKKAHFSGKGC